MAATYDFPEIYRGNTVKGPPSLALTVTSGGAAVTPTAVKCQIRTQAGRLVYTWPVTISGDIVVFPDISATETAKWRIDAGADYMDLAWQLEMTNTYGTHAYIGGTLRVNREVAI